MLYPEATLESWINKHDLVVRIKKCAKCGEGFKTSIPVLLQGYAGLETPTHECGRQFNAAIFTPISNSSIGEWEEIYFA